MNKQNESYETIIKENKKYLKDFESFLKKRNYRENTIEEHLSRVDYYINDYLMWGIPKRMENGCSLDVLNFIEDKVNGNLVPPSVHNIDFYLTSIRLFYECMCENNLIKKEQINDFIDDIHNFRDELIEDYYDKNPKILELYDVMEAIEFGHDFGEGFINIKTGQKEYLTEDGILSHEENEELYDMLESPEWVKVPEFSDYGIMLNFSLQLKDKNMSEKLGDILHHKKAYRNFKDAIYKMNIENQYYDYYQAEIEKLAKEWLIKINEVYNDILSFYGNNDEIDFDDIENDYDEIEESIDKKYS